MSENKSYIDNINNIKVASNEQLVKYTIWRNLHKLIQNDEKLVNLLLEITNGLIISLYDEEVTYKINDFVWYYKPSTNCMVLLKSIIDNNTNNPEYNNGSYYDNGWENLSEDIDINKTDIYDRLYNTLQNYIQDHEKEYHIHGILTKTNISDKLMKTDWSNRNLERQKFQFPYITGFLPEKSDNVILNGYYRLYDCGLIEYDIIYRFGYIGKKKIDGYEMDVLECNNLKIDKTEYNRRYFNDENSYDIFNNENHNSINKSIIGDTAQLNRNDFCNVYSAVIKFPREFRNDSYMIFNTGILSQTNDLSNISNGKNAITFTNKNKNSVTAVLITYPQGHFGIEDVGYNTRNGGLAANSFRCKIVGRTVMV